MPRYVAQAQLLGREIALWRSDAGAVNAWENRCPHRGVRLSIGYNTGNELRCQYHGWRFAAGSGQCTLIPAHPTQKPASGIRVGVYAAVERHHLVWVNLDAQIGAPDEAGAAVPRPIPARAWEPRGRPPPSSPSRQMRHLLTLPMDSKPAALPAMAAARINTAP